LIIIDLYLFMPMQDYSFKKVATSTQALKPKLF